MDNTDFIMVLHVQ